jgi:hypothetical protein
VSTSSSRIKSFGMTNFLVEVSLDEVESKYSIDLQRSLPGASDDTDILRDYYSQFGVSLRSEAADMAVHYQLFYCLEKSARELVKGLLVEKGEPDWWEKYAPEKVRNEVNSRVKKELESAITPRSDDPMDYTTFGELGEIVTANWDLFGGLFSNRAAFGKVMNQLNALRNPIAHCCPLAEDEQLRLRLCLRDWFRQME